MADEVQLTRLLKFDSGARSFKRAAYLLMFLAGGLLLFGAAFLWSMWERF